MANKMTVGTVAGNKIITKDMIDRWAEKLMNPVDRFLIRAYFEGMGNKNASDILNITQKDLDMCKDNFLYVRYPCKGGIVQNAIRVSDKLLKDAYDAADTYEYTFDELSRYEKYGRTNPLYDETVEEDEESPKYVIKSLSKNKHDWRYSRSPEGIYRAFIRISTMLGIPVNAEELRTSGMIHYINTKCKEMGITAKEFLLNDSYKHEFCWQYSLCVNRFDVDMFLDTYSTYLN